MKFWSIVVLKSSKVWAFWTFFSLLLTILKNGAEKPKSRFSNIRRTNKNLAIFSCLGDFLSKNWFIRLFTLRLHAVRGLIFKIVAFFQLTWSNPISHFRFGLKRTFNGSAWQYISWKSQKMAGPSILVLGYSILYQKWPLKQVWTRFKTNGKSFKLKYWQF